MSAYGIKLVWRGWIPTLVVLGFPQRDIDHSKTSVKPGTKMLLYETSGRGSGDESTNGAKGIIAEVEVTGDFILDNPNAPTQGHPHTVSIKLLRYKREHPIPVKEIRPIIHAEYFPLPGQTWIDLTEAQYQSLTKLWE